MKTYTVIGLYPNCLTDFPTVKEGSFCLRVRAGTPERAAEFAQIEAMHRWDPDWQEGDETSPADLMEVLYVFEGELRDLTCE